MWAMNECSANGPATGLPDLDRWFEWFTDNANAEDGVPWDANDRLSGAERYCIERSIAAFQLGEYSEGLSLMKFARVYAAEHGSAELVEITRLFILEEQHHAGMLRRFMRQHDIPVVKKNWTDTVFRRLRKNVGYELSITVLITAEIIALVYYRALAAATNSVVLQAICRKILADERAHVHYESGLIRYITSRHNLPRRIGTRALHDILFCGTVFVVYFEHRRVLVAGGFPRRGFWRAAWAEFRGYLHRQ